jgi:hypothetical protein
MMTGINVTEVIFWTVSGIKFLINMRIYVLDAGAGRKHPTALMLSQRKDDWLSFFVMWFVLIAESAKLTSYVGIDAPNTFPPLSFMLCWLGLLAGVYLQSFLLRRSLIRYRMMGSASARQK